MPCNPSGKHVTNVITILDSFTKIGYNIPMSKPRTKLEKRVGIQNTLEGYRRFDYDYIPFGTYSMPDGKYPYRQKGFGKAAQAVIRGVLRVCGPVLLKVAYGCRVEGKEHLRALREKKQGAICVSNHVALLDTLFVRQAIGHFHTYFTMAPWNNKRGLGGWFIRRGGMWAFSADLAAMRNLMHEMKTRLEEGGIVHFYAEQAMWTNYQKPRPMKDGAFYYAVRYNVPVLPVFFTFKVNKKGCMRRLVIHILAPVAPDNSLSRNERAGRLKAQAQAAWTSCYERAYGVTMEYLPDRRRNAK